MKPRISVGQGRLYIKCYGLTQWTISSSFCSIHKLYWVPARSKPQDSEDTRIYDGVLGFKRDVVDGTKLSWVSVRLSWKNTLHWLRIPSLITGYLLWLQCHLHHHETGAHVSIVHSNFWAQRPFYRLILSRFYRENTIHLLWVIECVCKLIKLCHFFVGTRTQWMFLRFILGVRNAKDKTSFSICF